MSQAFISYHRAQRKLARLLAHRIAADGHAVWWDRGERPGDTWSEAVSTALANSACVVVIWSKQAATSPYVLGEATAGYGKNALISVCADQTRPPSPFDRAPVIELQDWSGAGDDVAWIRLREPVRAKLEAAEKAQVADAPLPPGRAPPVRVGFSSAANTTYPPPPAYEERKGSPAGTLATLLVLGGLAWGGWQYRTEINEQLLALRAEWTPEEPATPQMPPLAPVTQAAVAIPSPAQPATPPLAEATPDQPMPLAEAAPASLPAGAAQRSPAPTPAPAMTYQDWRDVRLPTPPPPRAHQPASIVTPPPAPPPAPVAFEPPPPAVRRIALLEGRFIELDPAGGERATDLWFSPDRTGYGLFVGVANGARMRLVSAARATPAACADGLMRRNPIPVRDLSREGGLCVRSSGGAISAWRVEGLEKTAGVSTLRLVAVES
jgi:hypothetical protein